MDLTGEDAEGKEDNGAPRFLGSPLVLSLAIWTPDLQPPWLQRHHCLQLEMGL